MLIQKIKKHILKSYLKNSYSLLMKKYINNKEEVNRSKKNEILTQQTNNKKIEITLY